MGKAQEFTFCKINPSVATKEEIENEIRRLTHIMTDNKNLEQGLKIFLNSVYGAIGNPYFACHNFDMAEAITLQGQDLIKYMSTCIDHYFMTQWKDDAELHEKLGLTVRSNVISSTTVYCDTDSDYVSFQGVLDTIENFDDLGMTVLELMQKIYTIKLKPLFDTQLDLYATRWNTENIQDFELEMISYSGIWLAKKKYMLDVAWTDRGIIYKPQEKIKSTGVEIVQSKTSKFIRNRLKETVGYFFKKGNDIDVTYLASVLKKLKNKFKLTDIEEICMAQKITDYDKWVIKDKGTLELRLKCPIHVRAAATYNWMVNSKKEYGHKYTHIKSGDKIKYYYTKNKSDSMNVIGFLPGSFPFEFQEHFPFDYDTMFEKIVLSPINRILEAIGKQPIPKNLVTVKSLI